MSLLGEDSASAITYGAFLLEFADDILEKIKSKYGIEDCPVSREDIMIALDPVFSTLYESNEEKIDSITLKK